MKSTFKISKAYKNPVLVLVAGILVGATFAIVVYKLGV